MDQTLASQLRAGGLRVTRPRLAVLAVLQEASADRLHHPVSTIAAQARRRAGALSTQAVYDCLEALTRAGLVRCIEPAGSPARYEARVGDNHHHLVCRICGGATDVDCAVGAAPCLTPVSAVGFVVDEAEVIFWGRCDSCAEAGPGSGTARAYAPAPAPGTAPGPAPYPGPAADPASAADPVPTADDDA